MNDTSEEILKKQIEIILSKSEEERFMIGDELSAFGRRVLESSLRNEKPGISETDLKLEVFRRCYTQFYSPEQLELITKSMREFIIKSPG